MRTPVSAPSLFALALLSLGGCEIGQTNSNDDSADGDTDSDTDNTDNTDNAGDPDAAPGPGPGRRRHAARADHRAADQRRRRGG
jgi:hypothetical protein